MLHVLGVGLGRRGRFDEARAALSESTAISEDMGLLYMSQWSKRSRGRMELAAGDAVAAERALRESWDVLTKMGLHSSLGETAVPLAESLYAQGRFDEADATLKALERVAGTRASAPRAWRCAPSCSPPRGGPGSPRRPPTARCGSCARPTGSACRWTRCWRTPR